MIILPRKRLIVPRRLQRGSIILSTGGVNAAAAAGIVFDLSNMSPPYLDAGGATQTYGVDIRIRTDGTIDVLRDISADLNNEQDPYSTDPTNTWVRLTHQSGNDMTGGNTRGVWHQCNVERNFVMRHTSSGGNDEISGTFDLELSSDSGGVSIEAQLLGFTVNVGEIF